MRDEGRAGTGSGCGRAGRSRRPGAPHRPPLRERPPGNPEQGSEAPAAARRGWRLARAARPPPPGRAVVGQRAGHIPRVAEEMARIPPASPRSGLRAGGAGRHRGTVRSRCGELARAVGLPAPRTCGGSKAPAPEHVKGHRLVPGETAWPSPASSPLTWLWLIWGVVLQPWLMRLQILSLWDGAQHTSRADPSEEGAPGLTEASLSPSLCFWKVPAADVSQCSRPAFLACSAGLSLLQVLRAPQGGGSVGEADPSGGVSHQVV